jgi:hypothetical protein
MKNPFRYFTSLLGLIRVPVMLDIRGDRFAADYLHRQLVLDIARFRRRFSTIGTVRGILRVFLAMNI